MITGAPNSPERVNAVSVFAHFYLGILLARFKPSHFFVEDWNFLKDTLINLSHGGVGAPLSEFTWRASGCGEPSTTQLIVRAVRDLAALRQSDEHTGRFRASIDALVAALNSDGQGMTGGVVYDFLKTLLES